MSDSENNKAPSFDDTALARAIQALPREQQPTRDLWPELEMRLPRRAPRRARFAWAAAAAVAALAVSVWINPDLSPKPVSAPQVAQVDAASAEAQLLNVYELQKASQMADLNFTNPAVNRQLAIWDGAVQQVRGALNYYPEEPSLLRQLDRLYRQQLNYLETLAMADPQVAALY